MTHLLCRRPSLPRRGRSPPGTGADC